MTLSSTAEPSPAPAHPTMPAPRTSSPTPRGWPTSLAGAAWRHYGAACLDAAGAGRAVSGAARGINEGAETRKGACARHLGCRPGEGARPQPRDLVVEKMSMSAWETSRLEAYLRYGGRDTIISCDAWANKSVEHTARTGADKGFYMICGRRPAGLLLGNAARPVTPVLIRASPAGCGGADLERRRLGHRNRPSTG